MTSVGIVTMATGRYREFLSDLVSSAARHVVGLERVFVLSERPLPPLLGPTVCEWLPWGHFPWPYPTLLRYRAMASYRERLAAVDVLLYLDVDMLVCGGVDLSRMGEGLVAVRHPGYIDAPRDKLPYESRPVSQAYVAAEEGVHYFCGGVQGGTSADYLRSVDLMAGRIDRDLAHGVVPVWHDESVWNRLCIDAPPALVLSSDYCTPDSEQREGSRILAISKDHDYFREVSPGKRMVKTGRQAASRIRALGGRVLHRVAR